MDFFAKKKLVKFFVYLYFSAAIPQSKGLSIDNNETDDKKESESDNWGGQTILGWVKEAVSTNPILSKVAEKARSSVDTVLTTLDPQMKEIICKSP